VWSPTPIEPTGMSPLHFHRITRVVAVHGKGGDEDRAVDADLVHRGHHLVTRNVIGPIRYRAISGLVVDATEANDRSGHGWRGLSRYQTLLAVEELPR
jgi:hypothetical protein